MDVLDAGLLRAFNMKILIVNYKERTTYTWFFYSFIHSFSKCVLSACSLPTTVLGAANRAFQRAQRLWRVGGYHSTHSPQV